MEILRSGLKGLSELSNLKLIDRLRYVLDMLRFYRLKTDETRKASLFGYRINYDRFDNFSYLVREIFINLSYFCNVYNDSPVILDIGSNIGISTLFFKRLFPDSIIYCFEPDPHVFGILEKNVKENDLKNVFLINSAVSDHSGGASLYVPSWSSGSSSLFLKKLEIEKGFADMTMLEKNAIKEKEVEVMRCSQFIVDKGINRIDLLKIDAEGAEERITNDIKPFLNRIGMLMMEFHYSRDFRENRLSSIVSTLEEAEFLVSVEPTWMTNEPAVMATYLIRAINGNSKFLGKKLFR